MPGHSARKHKYTVNNYPCWDSMLDSWKQTERIATDSLNMEFKPKRKPMDTVGSLVDKLSIVNIKIYMAEDRKREPGATDKQIADATRLTNSLNTARNELIKEIDELNGVQNPITIKSYGKTV